jgi:hypothetical protein
MDDCMLRWRSQRQNGAEARVQHSMELCEIDHGVPPRTQDVAALVNPQPAASPASPSGRG